MLFQQLWNNQHPNKSDEDSRATPIPDSTAPAGSTSNDLEQIIREMDNNLNTEIVEITNISGTKLKSMDQVIKEKNLKPNVPASM